jgi:AcrR family transcriptional regulator
VRKKTASQARREREKVEMRDRILNAAHAIILKEGFAALTMRHLASAIEYSAASLYMHFKDRRAIARELSQRGYAALLSALQSSMKPGSAEASLRSFAQAYTRFGMEQPETYRLILMEAPEYVATVFDGKQPYDPEDPATQSFALLLDIVERLRRAARSRIPAQEIAESIWCGLHGIVSLKLTCGTAPAATAERLTELHVRSVLASLQPREA